MNLNKYISTIEQCLQERDAYSLSTEFELRINSESSSHVGFQVITKNINALTQGLEQSRVLATEPLIKKYIIASAWAIYYFSKNDIENSHLSQSDAFSFILEYFGERSEHTAWTIDMFCKSAESYRLICNYADYVSSDSNFKHLRDSVANLTKGFSIVARDRLPLNHENSKKKAIFYISNVLFKVYFRMNTLQLCSKLINIIEAPHGGISKSALRMFPVIDVIVFKYYVGKLKLLEGFYTEAREYFQFVIRYTPKKYIKQYQKALLYLIPLEMYHGVFPRETIGNQWPYLTLSHYLLTGNIFKASEHMDEFRKYYARLGVLLVLERTVAKICERNFLKLIISLMNNTTRLNLKMVESILKNLGYNLELEEIENMVSNLIYNNQLKGYISHEKSFLILSKADPFPKEKVITPFDFSSL